jgi:hypothetical protein
MTHPPGSGDGEERGAESLNPGSTVWSSYPWVHSPGGEGSSVNLWSAAAFLKGVLARRCRNIGARSSRPGRSAGHVLVVPSGRRESVR